MTAINAGQPAGGALPDTPDPRPPATEQPGNSEGPRDAHDADVLAYFRHLPEGEPLANLKARATLLGVILIATTTAAGWPELLACQGAWVRAFHDMTELEAWLSKLEGSR